MNLLVYCKCEVWFCYVISCFTGVKLNLSGFNFSPVLNTVSVGDNNLGISFAGVKLYQCVITQDSASVQVFNADPSRTVSLFQGVLWLKWKMESPWVWLNWQRITVFLTAHINCINTFHHFSKLKRGSHLLGHVFLRCITTCHCCLTVCSLLPHDKSH